MTFEQASPLYTATAYALFALDLSLHAFLLWFLYARFIRPGLRALLGNR